MQFYPSYSVGGYLAAWGQGVAAYSGPGGAPQPACIRATILGPYHLTDADELVVTVNGAAPAFPPRFDAAPAERTCTNAEPYNVDTLDIQVRIGPVTEPVQTVVLAGVAATAADVALQLAVLVGAQALDAAGRVRIRTDVEGTSARLEFVGGTALAVLGFPVAVFVGAGNVADIDAVTADEVAAIVTAALAPDAVGTNHGGLPEICTVATGPTATIEVAGGDAQASMGFVAGEEIAGLGRTQLVAIRWGKSRGMLTAPPSEPRPS